MNPSRTIVILSCLIVLSLQGASSITCPEGKTLQPKVDYTSAPNGCGGNKSQSKLDDIFNPYSDLLKSCCNDHDVCFATCDTSGNAKSSFKQCNDDFNSCLKGKCSKKSGASKILCKAWAKSYYTAVSTFGAKYYNQEQKASCQCQ